MIVLVEDDENSRFIFEAAVEYCSPRFHIEFFFDVNSCRDALQASQVVPATILLDYNLGSETGLTLLQWLRGPASPAGLRDLVVIMFSGNGDDPIVESCYLAGADF
ncbi:MAG: response regulator, partial [Verrucomicrobiota bacterium]